MDTTRPTGKGRAPDLPFPGSVINATRRRCRLTAIERAGRAWCAEHRQAEHPAFGAQPDPAAVAAWLVRLGVLVDGAVELFQLACGSEAHGNRHLEWRAEFEVRRWDDQYLNAASVGYLLGIDRPQQQHKTVRRLAESGYLLGHSFFEGHDERHRSPRPSRAKGRKRQPTPGATRWRFHPDDVARFLTDHPEQYDRAKVRGNPWRALAAEAHKRRKWLRVPEVAERLGCSASNVRDMLRYGDLQGVLMRDRQSISYYVRPVWVLDYQQAAQTIPLRRVPGRSGATPEVAARRARILAERAVLQGKHDPEAKRLLCEVRDTAGRRRKAHEAAASALAAD